MRLSVVLTSTLFMGFLSQFAMADLYVSVEPVGTGKPEVISFFRGCEFRINPIRHEDSDCSQEEPCQSVETYVDGAIACSGRTFSFRSESAITSRIETPPVSISPSAKFWLHETKISSETELLSNNIRLWSIVNPSAENVAGACGTIEDIAGMALSSRYEVCVIRTPDKK